MRKRRRWKRTSAYGALFVVCAIGGLLLGGLGGVALGSNADTTTTEKHTDSTTRKTTTQGTSTSGDTTTECSPGTAPDGSGVCVPTTDTQPPTGPPDTSIFEEGLRPL